GAIRCCEMRPSLPLSSGSSARPLWTESPSSRNLKSRCRSSETDRELFGDGLVSGRVVLRGLRVYRSLTAVALFFQGCDREGVASLWLVPMGLRPTEMHENPLDGSEATTWPRKECRQECRHGRLERRRHGTGRELVFDAATPASGVWPFRAVVEPA